MNYISTRDLKQQVTAAQAIARGISAEGGLFVPEIIPTLTDEDFANLCKMNYPQRASFVLGKFLGDFTAEEVDYCTKGAYVGTFDEDKPAPLHTLCDGTEILELWHGPTCAFKDLALQILPFLLTTSAKKVNGGKKTVILVATSGDTGKAALEGFKDVPGTEIMVFYPSDGVSAMQKLQMDTQVGENVCVYAIKGNFDDAQSGVKKIFTDPDVAKKLEENNMLFSSANSINWGRLAPQIVYYVSAYCDLLNRGEKLDNGFNVAVPTGNFGNILAAYYAKKMGVPVGKLICASNANKVLTDFLATGVYDRNRSFFTTISPSMDILISSNLERMLFELSDRDASKTVEWQNALKNNGSYKVDAEVKAKLDDLFYGGYCDDAKTKETIKTVFDKFGYLCDTHTAVAVNVAEEYKEKTGDTRPMVIASTASPYKFANSVLSALGKNASDDEFDAVEQLKAVSGTVAPTPLAELKGKKPRFNNLCEADQMEQVVLEYLKIK
ncbi:MAG: threonine synthase [Clostridia bacterium]|nr:threonine synthase [Clostridia bacterium]